MQNTFQCPNCNSSNTIGQAFCINCGHKLEYNCPNCGNPVDPSIAFCTNCGSTLAWPDQHQTESQTAYTEADYPKTPIDYGNIHIKSNNKSKRRWPVGLTIIVVVLLIAAGLILAIDIFDLKLFNLPASEEPIVEPPPPQTPAETPAITPTIVTFEASPTEILLGEPVKLQWNVIDATKVYFDHDIGEVQISGELTVFPKTNTTYILTAINNKETVTQSTAISVIENINAADIALTEEDVKPSFFIFETHSEPTLDQTISNFHVVFNRGDEKLSVSIFLFKDIPAAEEHYLEIKYNNRSNIGGITTLGDVGYYLTFIDDPMNSETYSIRFIKNNAYVNITGLEKLDELESFGKIIESRIK